MNRHQFEQAAKHFRAGRITLSDFADQMFPKSKEPKPGSTAAQGQNPAPKLGPRKLDAHKGDFGRVLAIGGSSTMPGAISLSAMAALRSGSGLVVVATTPETAPVVAGFSPCYVTVGVNWADSQSKLDEYLEWADVIALGPGLGTEPASAMLAKSLYETASQPMVIDADGLNGLVEQNVDFTKQGGQRILTPHPGEFRRLVNEPITRRESAEEAAMQFAIQSNVVIALKGHQTFVTDGENRFRNETGNPGMATGGSGDVLTGVIASLIGQGLNGFDAACLGVKVHGVAGDLAAKRLGQVSLVSSDLLDFLPAAFQS